MTTIALTQHLHPFLSNWFEGDEVSFVVRQTPKGLQAEGLQLMIAEVGMLSKTIDNFAIFTFST